MSFEAVLLENGFSLEEAQAIIEEFFTDNNKQKERKNRSFFYV